VVQIANWLREMVPSAKAMGVWRGRGGFLRRGLGRVGGGEFRDEIGGRRPAVRGVSMRVAEPSPGDDGEGTAASIANRSWQRFSGRFGAFRIHAGE